MMVSRSVEDISMTTAIGSTHVFFVRELTKKRGLKTVLVGRSNCQLNVTNLRIACHYLLLHPIVCPITRARHV